MAREDQFVRAAIDLSTVTNVTQPASIPPGAPKKADERWVMVAMTMVVVEVSVMVTCMTSGVVWSPACPRCFFDVHTSRRSYSLCAETRQEAVDWQEKIQSCL